MTERRFGPGEFYGDWEIRRSVSGFALGSFRASFREPVETHSHDCAHFVLVLSGGYVTGARGADEVMCAPTLLFNPAGTRHRDRFAGGGGRFVTVSLDGLAGPERYPLLDGPPVVLPDTFALRAARLIERELRRPAASGLVLEAAAWQLVMSGSEERAGTDPPRWLGRAVEMIRDTDPADLSVGAVAAVAGVHPVHLARVFRDWLGCTPGEYLRGRRLERAAALVGRTALALADVAAATGYADQAHMTHAFRRGLAMTPDALRRNGDVAPLQDAVGAVAQISGPASD
jgi:AraC family transcriptional regulator